jgi:hypothetical protein
VLPFLHSKHPLAYFNSNTMQTENVLLTSWSWVFLSDYAPYKPTFLPADNPVKMYSLLLCTILYMTGLYSVHAYMLPSKKLPDYLHTWCNIKLCPAHV